MNRTNLCIRMLQLLKARGKMNTTQLATELEVNPRNIREFKKELVLAGYNVEEVKGRYGGYILNDEYDLPVTIFSDEQKDALVQSYKFMRTQPISLCVHKKTLNPFHYIVMRWIRLFRQARFHPTIPYTICPILWN